MDYPTFEVAVDRFRKFLNEEEAPAPIGWVFPRDTVLVDRRWAVRPRDQEVVVKEVASTYQLAIGRRLGVKLGVLFRSDDVLWCYVFCPKDRTEAEYCLMPDGLKLSIGSPPDSGRVIVSESEWRKLLLRDQIETKRQRFT